jgi:hypothetical protein
MIAPVYSGSLLLRSNPRFLGFNRFKTKVLEKTVVCIDLLLPGFRLGARMNALGIRPRSHVAILYSMWSRPMSSTYLCSCTSPPSQILRALSISLAS